MAATTVACDREKKSRTNPPSCPAKKRVGFSVPGSSNTSSLPRNYSFQCSKRVVPSQPQTPLKFLFILFYLFLVWFLFLVKNKVDIIQPSTCAHTHAERERERVVDFGGEIIGPDDV
ncbi:unnamed protein product [Camellia sinensis]